MDCVGVAVNGFTINIVSTYDKVIVCLVFQDEPTPPESQLLDRSSCPSANIGMTKVAKVEPQADDVAGSAIAKGKKETSRSGASSWMDGAWPASPKIKAEPVDTEVSVKVSVKGDKPATCDTDLPPLNDKKPKLPSGKSLSERLGPPPDKLKSRTVQPKKSSSVPKHLYNVSTYWEWLLHIMHLVK